MKAKDIKYIAIHCTASFATVQGVLNYWKKVLGWQSPGYHVLIDEKGIKHYLQPFNLRSNGVRYYNGETLHISYIGGVDKRNTSIAKDTRTNAQRIAIIEVIQEMIQYLEDNGKKDLNTGLMVLGHRDFSPDKNADGVISKYERLKECPSFDAIEEYKMYSSSNKKQLLPYNRK